MTTQVNVSDTETTWLFSSFGGKGGGASTPGAWEIAIDNDAETFTLTDCIMMRGPITGNLGSVTGDLGAAYVAAKIDVDTHAVTAATYATVLAGTDSAVPEDPSYIKVVLYRLAQNAAGAWYVAADFRNQLSLVMYV